MTNDGKPFPEAVGRDTELPMTEFDRTVEEAAEKLPGRVRHCLRSAYQHLRMSWRLHPVDAEMSLFRALTAEEEAATALILALKQRQYVGSDRINPRNHVHKVAVSAFLDAVQTMLAEVGMPSPQLHLDRRSKPGIALTFDIGSLLGDAEERYCHLPDPFDYVLRREDEAAGYEFGCELDELARARGARSISQLVSAEANLRNRLLYASDDGIPGVEFPDALIVRRLARVRRLSLIVIGILQTDRRQLFAAQCVRAYCRVIGQIVADETDYGGLERPEGFSMAIVQQLDGSYVETSRYRAVGTIPIRYAWLETWKGSSSQPSSTAGGG